MSFCISSYCIYFSLRSLYICILVISKSLDNLTSITAFVPLLPLQPSLSSFDPFLKDLVGLEILKANLARTS